MHTRLNVDSKQELHWVALTMSTKIQKLHTGARRRTLIISMINDLDAKKSPPSAGCSVNLTRC